MSTTKNFHMVFRGGGEEREEIRIQKREEKMSEKERDILHDIV